MDLVCPHCQKRLTIDDGLAGTVLPCPLCQGALQAPMLLNMPPPSTLPSAEPLAAASPATADPTAPPDVVTPLPEAQPPAPGDYSHKVRLHLRPDILEWITPGALVAVFVLSLFTWYYAEDYQLNLWQLAFTDRGYAVYTLYTVVLVFAAMPLAIITVSLEKGWIPIPVGLRPYWPWRSLLVAGAVALPFVFFLVDYVNFQFLPYGIQASMAMKLAFRLHALAVVSSALQIWLARRKQQSLPLPRIDLRW